MSETLVSCEQENKRVETILSHQDLRKLETEVLLNNEPISIKTLDGRYIDMSMNTLLFSLCYSSAIKKNNNNYTNPGLNEKLKPKEEQIADEELVFTYIEDRTAVKCCISSGSPEIKKIQTFLSTQNYFDGCMYEGTIDGVLDETTKNAILKYNSGNSRFNTYTTNSQGEIRYFYNPSSGDKLTYSLGVTLCPYNSIEEVFINTPLPTSAGASDFFCNFINTKTEDININKIEDTGTGNIYYNNPSLQAVFLEGENHRNIQRFLIEPHYSNLGISKTEARINVVYDLFKYYLFFYRGNRDLAKHATLHLMTTYVDPLVNSTFDKRYHENYKVFFQGYMFPVAKPKADVFSSPLNLFSSDTDDNGFIEKVLLYNEEHPEEPYTEEEIVQVLVDYNIHFRKKSSDQAKKIVAGILQKQKVKLYEAIKYNNEHGNTEEVKKLQAQLDFFSKKA